MQSVRGRSENIPSCPMRQKFPPIGGQTPMFALFVLSGFLLISACSSGEDKAYREWRVYGGDKGSTRYSDLDQINRENVHQLEVAWIHHTGDIREESNWSQIQCNPIVIDSVLYATSPGLKLIALHAGTGERIWNFDPWPDHSEDPEDQGVNRGVVYWQNEDETDRRIFFTASYRLYALDAVTGKPIPSFGKEGWIDLHDGLDRDVSDRWVVITTPGIIYKDLLIVGGRMSERTDAAPGHIRAFDVRTGERKWIFHTIPHPGEFGYETWPPEAYKTIGAANSWAGLALDEKRGIVYVPTGSAAFDYYGGNRPGENLFANSLLALNAETGERIWHFQLVHHDILDRDPPAPPNLVTVRHGGRRIDAVAQVTKTGHVFLFNRETGEPVFPIEERPAPPSDLKGEAAWPTQPFPVKPEPLMRQHFTEDLVSDISPETHERMLARFRQTRSDGPYLPLNLEETIVFPGLDGGSEWGGAAVDPEKGILYVNINEMPWILQLQEEVDFVKQFGRISGEAVYQTYCAACHGPDQQGDGNRTPSLLGLTSRRSPEEVATQIRQGKGFMPAFNMLSQEELESVVAFVLDEKTVTIQNVNQDEVIKLPYTFKHFGRFLDEDGYPAIKPPWGTLNAVDLNTGEILWKVPLGEFAELTKRGIPPTGTENYGGPVVTAGGLIFIGASKDEKFRAFDRETGLILWETQLPAGGYATPATYEYRGKQYIVIAAGGGKMGTRKGDAYVAFTLPDQASED